MALVLLIDGHLRPYFIPFRREQAVGAAPEPVLDNRFFAYDGELVQGQGLLVELLNNVFNLVNAMVVPTVEAIRTHLAAHPQGNPLFTH